MSHTVPDEGAVVVVSGPSGAGKHTLLVEALKSLPDVAYAVSATTRPPRLGEIDGKDYYFMTAEEFENAVKQGHFAEWATVHDHLYGTLNKELDRLIAASKTVILELDVQGMRSIRDKRNDIMTVFIAPPSPEEQEKRLRKRGATGSDLENRLKNTQAEMDARPEYDVVIVNEHLEQAADELQRALRGKGRPSSWKT